MLATGCRGHTIATEDVIDGLTWWYERQKIFPQLSRMAYDYLSIPSEFLFF